MRFERTTDTNLIKSIATNPRVWYYLADDYSPPRDKWNPSLTDGTVCVAVKEEDRVLGVVIFIRQNWVIWELHPVLHPDTYWGGKSKEATLGAMQWLWANFPMCQRIVGYVPVFEHKTKLRLPIALGMTQYGLNPKSHRKNGKLYDIAEFGVSRLPIPSLDNCLRDDVIITRG